MASRRTCAHGSSTAHWHRLRSYTRLSRAQFRQSPQPAAFARSEPPLPSSYNVLTTSAGTNSLLLDTARFMSQHPVRRKSHHDSWSVEENVARPGRGQDATSGTYEMLLQRLYQVNRFTAVKLGLENMQQLNAAFGDPASQLEVVHVAGTNGKGSVALKVAKALERSGYKTGLFVSPHVACFRERVQINGSLITESEVSELLSEIFNLSAQLRIPATFFEITTMLAFRYFARQDVDCVVLETGLGGRLDSTNIVNPVLSVITSIGLDHVRILGNDLDAIAREKAGIIKPNVPVVVGPNVPMNVTMEYATRNNAALVRVPPVADSSEDYNVENAAIAREACAQLNALCGSQPGTTARSKLCVDLSDKRVSAALECRPPCRFQVLHVMRANSKERKVTVVLDVAHNPHAIDRLVRLLHKRFPDKTFRFVCGFSADKDITKMLEHITAVIRRSHPHKSDEELQQHMHFVKANHPRGALLDDISQALIQSSNVNTEKCKRVAISSIKDGVDAAVAASRASTDDEVVVVCGSVFIMAEARQALGLKEPVDSASLITVAASSQVYSGNGRVEDHVDVAAQV
uniref:Mur ligase central domain-containing protein n=1 Tax=Peronospora matthiolae TaxID=2874970 RepID=A0AAV1U6S8_9STRA